MGQQQLLLLVLATVIVGLATVAGIQAFEQGSVRANQDALTQTSIKIATDIQAHLQEPEQFGGAGYDSWKSGISPSDVSFSDLGYSSSGGTYSTTDGDCEIVAAGSAATSTAPSSKSSNSNQILVNCTSNENNVTVGISGFDDDGINSVQETN